MLNHHSTAKAASVHTPFLPPFGFDAPRREPFRLGPVARQWVKNRLSASAVANPVQLIADPSWTNITRVEPDLLAIEAAAQLANPSEGDFDRAYESFKRQLKRFVGFGARRPQLRSCEAFEVAIQQIVAAMEAMR